MRRVIVVVLVSLFMLTACGKNAFTETTEVVKKAVGIDKAFLEKMESADNPEQIINAMESYTKELEALGPQWENVSAKLESLEGETSLKAKMDGGKLMIAAGEYMVTQLTVWEKVHSSLEAYPEDAALNAAVEKLDNTVARWFRDEEEKTE
jgi:ABC-type glycerol-3-phosphate transport system substrate-binding protein